MSSDGSITTSRQIFATLASSYGLGHALRNTFLSVTRMYIVLPQASVFYPCHPNQGALVVRHVLAENIECAVVKVHFAAHHRTTCVLVGPIFNCPN